MKNNAIIYSLTVEDIQTVANDLIQRDLTGKEIKKLIDSIAEKIVWYNAIAESIHENLHVENTD